MQQGKYLLPLFISPLIERMQQGKHSQPPFIIDLITLKIDILMFKSSFTNDDLDWHHKSVDRLLDIIDDFCTLYYETDLDDMELSSQCKSSMTLRVDKENIEYLAKIVNAEEEENTISARIFNFYAELLDYIERDFYPDILAGSLSKIDSTESVKTNEVQYTTMFYQLTYCQDEDSVRLNSTPT